jgi:hypothetical protein
MVENSDIELLCEEYKTLVEESSKEASILGLDDSLSRLEGKLIINADWTKSGVNELMKMAEYYGVFMLRNALALAIALDYQDGICGF